MAELTDQGSESIYGSSSSVELNETSARVSIPRNIKYKWGLRYGTYIRTNVGRLNERPVISFSPIENRERTNDLKMTSTGTVPLPKRLIRLFGVEGDINWLRFENNKLLGSFSEYNGPESLLHIVDYYSSEDEVEIVRQQENDISFTHFSDLQAIADYTLFHSEENPNTIKINNSAFHHQIPNQLSVNEGDEYLFVLIDDDYSFLLTLIPVEDSNQTSNFPEYTKKTIIINSYYSDLDPSVEVVADISGASEEYVSWIFRQLDRGDILESEIEASLNDELRQSIESQVRRTSSSSSSYEDYSMKHNPMKAAPEDLSSNYEQVKAPTEILNYDKDTVKIKKNQKNDELYYTIPKVIAETLWIDDGYTTDWMSINSLLLARITPKDRSKIEGRF